MKNFLITEEEKSRILKMYQSATSRHYLNEDTTPYDPWIDFGGGGKGMKFKSKEDYISFTSNFNVSFTANDGPNFPNIMKKNEFGTYVLKSYEVESGKVDNALATIQGAGMSLFLIAAANSLKGLLGFRTITEVNVWYTRKSAIFGKMFPQGGSLGTPQGLVTKIDEGTDKVFKDVMKDWSNIVSLKLNPIYTARVTSYASIPAQPK